MTISRGVRRDWPAEWVETLKTMRAKGYPSSKIAAAIGHGITRSAVLGKVKRLGLELLSDANVQALTKAGHAGRVRKPRVYKTAARGPRLRAPRPTKPRLAPDLFGPPAPPPSIKTAKVLLLAGYGECRWPVFGEGEGRLFCCGTTSGKSSYCAHHLALSIGKPLKAYRFTSQHAMAQAGAPYAEAA